MPVSCCFRCAHWFRLATEIRRATYQVYALLLYVSGIHTAAVLHADVRPRDFRIFFIFSFFSAAAAAAAAALSVAAATALVQCC